MNSLSKRTWVIVGIVAVFWAGTQLFTDPEEGNRQDRVGSRREQPGNDKVLRGFHQELAALRNRLARVENLQPSLSLLQDQLTRLEVTQRDLQAELGAESLQDDRFAHGEQINGSAVAPDSSEGERAQNLLAHVETHFWQESDDPTWSRGTETSIAHALTSAAFDASRLLAADCRTTLCQVEVSHESEVAQEGFIDTFPFALSFETEVFYQHIDDGRSIPRTVMYMARAGQRLPVPTQ
jgi:hypothetical protein